jgi:hypothetical protein
MKFVKTEAVHATYQLFCDGCHKVYEGFMVVCNPLHIVPGYGHWADMEELDFCSDKCLVSFFQKGIEVYGGMQLPTSDEPPLTTSIYNVFTSKYEDLTSSE